METNRTPNPAPAPAKPKHCAVCDGPFQKNGEPMFCEFCPVITGDEVAALPELPADTSYFPDRGW